MSCINSWLCMLCVISRKYQYNRWAVFFFPHIFWRYCWHRIVFIYLINEKHTFLRWTYWYKTLGNLSHPPPLSHTLNLLRWLHFWWPRISHVLVPEFSSDHASIPDAWIWIFHFPIFVVSKTMWSLLRSKCALIHGYISGCLAGTMHLQDSGFLIL